jgi:proline iminopeptidase
VSEIVLNALTTFRPSEIDWLYRGLSRFFPEAWARFHDHVAGDGGDIIAAYSARMEHPDEAVRIAASRAWCDWEDAVLSFETSEAGQRTLHDQIAFVRICSHYACHAAWLADGQLIANVNRIAHIPARLIHGRRDMTCPVTTAYELVQSWPQAKLIILEDAGHLRSDSKRAALLEAFDFFARSATA